MADEENNSEIAPESAVDKTSRTMLLVMLAIVVMGIMAFLLIRPRPSGTKPPSNPMKSSLSGVRSGAESPYAAAG